MNYRFFEANQDTNTVEKNVAQTQETTKLTSPLSSASVCALFFLSGLYCEYLMSARPDFLRLKRDLVENGGNKK